jgi:hypothetical protein
MSSQKLKPNELSANNEEFDSNGESFSGRICDDLCEVLLSYLSFEDKIRFECVSKQFQSCVFVKQNTIEVVEYPLNNKNTLSNLFNRISKNENFNYKIFESVLKKCQFINEVIIESKSVQILKLIIKNCNNLKSIAFDFNGISDQLIEEFGLKFGQKLRQIQFINAFGSNDNITKCKKLLRLCPNLITFGDRYVTHLSLFVDKNEPLIPKLSEVVIRLRSQGIQLIETFAKNYGNSVKSVLFDACLGIDNIETNILMKQMIHLKNLTKLDLMLEFSANSSQEFVDNLKKIAIHCDRLKLFKFDVFGTNPSLDCQIFNCLGFFENLKILILNLVNNNIKSNGISCKPLKLKLLTHLKIQNPKMNDIFFEDIDKNLPQLKSLDITVVNYIVRDKAMSALSKLSKLKSFEIR